jgi:hypothetical protein
MGLVTPGACRVRRLLGALLLAAFTLGAAAPAHAAEPLPQPSGRVVLTVSGTVANPNAGSVAVFDLAMLEALPQHDVVTRTPWTGGEPVVFRGPLARDVLAAAGATGSVLIAIALNDYRSTLPVADLAADDVIIATRRGGETMSVRDKGPLWIIYPLTEKPALDTLETHAKMAWQLKEIQVR